MLIYKGAILSALITVYLLVETVAREKEWWEKTTIYQIYLRSFKDSNGNGVGDLNGIYEKLDYIKDIGVETIWVQPFYQSPMADFGYDVSDFTKIDPLFGTMDDFKKLLKEMHDRGLKMMIDMVPNHVSDESEWFKKSVKKEEPYTDFFIWRDPKGIDPITKERIYPNNWLSLFGGTAWEWNEERQQFYYRLFSKKQPDLNYWNPTVREAWKGIMKFWLDLGVDGFRMDAVKHLMEDKDLKDEPYRSPELKGSKDWRNLDHIYTTNMDESYELICEWRAFLDEYKIKDNYTRIMCTEAYENAKNHFRYYGNETHRGAHFPFNFGFVFYERKYDANMFNTLVHRYYDDRPDYGVPNWVAGNHDNPRIADRVSREFTDAMTMVQLLLPGVASIYFGDEIGMEGTLLRDDQIRDPNNNGGGLEDIRDFERAPMQWNSDTNAGFTKNKIPWLPLHPSYWYKNVEQQLKEPKSHLKIFKRLMALRKSPVIASGELETCVISSWVFMYVRKLESEPTMAVIINLGSETESACAKNCFKYLPDEMTVHTSSVNSVHQTGDKFTIADSENITCSVLRPKAGVVLTSRLEAENHGTILSHSVHLLLLLLSFNFLKLSC